MSQCMTISEVAEQICEHDTRIWRVVNHYVKEARSREDFSDVTVIGSHRPRFGKTRHQG